MLGGSLGAGRGPSSGARRELAGLQGSHAIERLGLQVVALAHDHQAGFALGEGIDRAGVVVAVDLRSKKFWSVFAQYIRHFVQEVIMFQLGKARRREFSADGPCTRGPVIIDEIPALG